jgi:hypothetical protein
MLIQSGFLGVQKSLLVVHNTQAGSKAWPVQNALLS